MKTGRILLIAAGVLLVWGGARAGWASTEPLFAAVFYLTPKAPICDARGAAFPGTWGRRDGGRVEIREVGGGVVTPMRGNGAEVEAANPLLGALQMGDHVVGEDTGLFCAVFVTNQPVLGTKYFVRAYDNRDPGKAMVYADSEIFEVSYFSDKAVTREVGFGAARNLTEEDPYADGDGDGYTAAEEARLRRADRDGDGWSDWFELTHGMAVDVPYTLEITGMEAVEEPDAGAVAATGKTLEELTDEELLALPWSLSGGEIFWPAVSGVTYIIEFAEILEGTNQFRGVLTNVADSAQGVADVSDYITNAFYPVGFFRVKATNEEALAVEGGE